MHEIGCNSTSGEFSNLISELRNPDFLEVVLILIQLRRLVLFQANFQKRNLEIDPNSTVCVNLESLMFSAS
jgi:hypothetical protein